MLSQAVQEGQDDLKEASCFKMRLASFNVRIAKQLWHMHMYIRQWLQTHMHVLQHLQCRLQRCSTAYLLANCNTANLVATCKRLLAAGSYL